MNKRLLQSIKMSESTTVEWKQSLGEMKEIIESVAAFANTDCDYCAYVNEVENTIN